MEWRSGLRIKKQSALIIALIFLACGASAQQSGTQCEDLFNKMFYAINNIKTLQYKLYAVERINNNLTVGHSLVKVNTSPLKIYYKSVEKGIEVLWADGLANGYAIVNPNGFPYVNLHLDPLGKLMRNGQHQTVLRLGYAYFGNILFHSLAKFPGIYKNCVNLKNDTVWNNTLCYKVEINFAQYSNIPYIVTQEGETVSKIADQYFLSDYEVLTLNNISWYEDNLKIGQRLLLPAAYAKRLVLFISKDNYLPLVIRVYDDKGLFEEYEFSDLQINTDISEAEFSENYPGYHFN